MKMSKARGGNALGLDVDGHLISTCDESYLPEKSNQNKIRSANHEPVNLLALSWTDKAFDDIAYKFADSYIAEFRQAAENLGSFHPFIYINYANKGQDVFSSYGEKNRQRLTGIQKAVDPDGVFTSSGLWPGFFKIN
jgi:hypothetical protein